MQTQTIFKAGNSEVIAIPKHILEELNLKRGQKVVVDSIPDSEVIIIRKVSKAKTQTKKAASAEFKRWLNEVLKEDAEILDELALC